MNGSVLEKAQNCENCKDNPCQKGCPLNNDIASFIDFIKKREYENAFDVLKRTSVLMPICGRICPKETQCEGSCIKIDNVKIGELESFIGDLWLKNGWKLETKDKTKGHVAIVGSGPAGLTCAAFLRRRGINVTIYEKYNYLGGLLMHGIPDFRLSKDIVKKVTDNIIGLGIDVKYNMEFGKNLTLQYLKKEYDAVFIGIGANVSNKLGILGEDLENVYGANELLEHNINIDYQDKTVIVVGGGNVSMDISRTAIRNNAKRVIVVYRKGRESMSACFDEVESAVNDGVEFLFYKSIKRIIGDKKVEKIEVINNENEELEYMSCDYVIMAIGSHPEAFVSSLELEHSKNYLLVDNMGQTNDEKVFAGGDVTGSVRTVAWASKAGRTASSGIIKYLKEKNIVGD